MQYRNNVAYDLSRFEAHEEVQQPPRLRVVKPKPAPQAQTGLFTLLKAVSIALILVVLVACNISSQLALTDLSNQIEKTNQQIRILEGDAVRLQSHLESRMSLRVLEETASARLGLGKPDPSQITYVNMSQGDQVVRRQSASPESVWQWMAGLLQQ